MFNSIADIFNNAEASYNDPLHEIHNPVQSCNHSPEFNEYEEFLNELDPRVYPNPIVKSIHNTVNPLHGALKPIVIINK